MILLLLAMFNSENLWCIVMLKEDLILLLLLNLRTVISVEIWIILYWKSLNHNLGKLQSPFVGAAVPDQGFLVIPDIRNAPSGKEIFQGIIEVVKGNVSSR